MALSKQNVLSAHIRENTLYLILFYHFWGKYFDPRNEQDLRGQNHC